MDSAHRFRQLLRVSPVPLALALVAGLPAAAAAVPTARQPTALAGQGIMALVRTSDGYVIAGTARGAWRSKGGNGGFAKLGLPASVTALATDARNRRIVVAAASRRLYRSRDAGKTWTALARLAKGSSQPAGIVSVGVAGKMISVATGTGVYSSKNTGATWTRTALSDGVLSVALEGSTSLPFVGLRTRGFAYSWSAGRFRIANAGLPSPHPVQTVATPRGPGAPVLIGVCGRYYSLLRAQIGTSPWQPIGRIRVGGSSDCGAFQPTQLANGNVLLGNRVAVGACSGGSCVVTGRVPAGLRVLSVTLANPLHRGQAWRMAIGTTSGITWLPLPPSVA